MRTGWTQRIVLLVVLASITVPFVMLYAAPERMLAIELARRQWSAGVSGHDVDVDGQRWHYLQRGPADGDVVVLLHGLQGEAANWLDVVGQAPSTRRYVVPDLPGFGGSPTPADRDFRVDAQVVRLHAFLAALKIERFDLVGHSMGGYVAGRYAAQHPLRVRTIAFVDAAGVPFTPNEFMHALERGENPYRVTTREEFDAFLGKVFKHRPFLPRPVQDVYADRVIARADDWDAAMNALKADDQRYGLVPDLPQLTMPSLVLWCREDQVLDVSSIDAFSAGLPSESVVLLDDCGHMPLMEKPQDTANALAALWRSVYAAN